MGLLPDAVVGLVVRSEDGLDRLKLAYKERFGRFKPARVVPYRGHGRPDLLLLRGRVLEDDETGFEPEPGIMDDILHTIRRVETDEIRGALLRARFRDREMELRADDEAFFDLRIEPDPPVEPGWHEVRLEIIESMADEDTGPATGEVLVPPADADFFVVSDLDDTVLRTGATGRVSMLRTTLLNDAHSRLPFDGVAALYRALEAGAGGAGANPFFYLSRSAWNLYEMLVGFLDHRELPKGPLLLKDYGMRTMLGQDEDDYKRASLDGLLALYPDARFVLIGDSGQGDPEVYCALAEAAPDRIRAIVIRDVTDPERDREVRALADRLDDIGVPMILASDSAHAAEALVELGLIHADRLGEIEADRESQEDHPRRLRDRLLGK